MAVTVLPTETVIIASVDVRRSPVKSVQVTNLDAVQTVTCTLYAALGVEQLAPLALVDLTGIGPLASRLVQVSTDNLSQLELRGVTDGGGASVQAVMA